MHRFSVNGSITSIVFIVQQNVFNVFQRFLYFPIKSLDSVE